MDQQKFKKCALSLDELKNYSVEDDEQRIIVDSIINENEYDYIGAGIPDHITVISKSAVIDGDITTDSAVALNGRLNGNVTSKEDIGVSGLVVGQINGKNVNFQHAGIRGDVNADESVSVENGTIVVGNINAKTVNIDGKVKGEVQAVNSIDFRSQALMVGKVYTGSVRMDEKSRVNAAITLVNQANDFVDDSEFELGV